MRIATRFSVAKHCAGSGGQSRGSQRVTAAAAPHKRRAAHMKVCHKTRWAQSQASFSWRQQQHRRRVRLETEPVPDSVRECRRACSRVAECRGESAHKQLKHSTLCTAHTLLVLVVCGCAREPTRVADQERNMILPEVVEHLAIECTKVSVTTLHRSEEASSLGRAARYYGHTTRADHAGCIET